MKRYKAYKPSGVDWIGEVPDGWEVKPFKALFYTEKGLSFTKADLVDEGIPVISYGQIHSKQNDFISTKDCLLRYIPANLIPKDSKSYVEIGDFIFADTSEDIVGCGNYAYIDKNGIYAGYHTIIAKSIQPENSRYFSFLFQTDCWRSQVRYRVSGVKVYSITKQILTSVKMLVPPLPEQSAIAAYLDAKCAKIDNVVAVQQKRIELLKELKQSIITHAVTRGLDKNAKMKDSGVEWIGDVPVLWQIIPFKHCAGINNGADYKDVETDDEDAYPVVGSGGVFAYATKYMYDGEVIF